jgi:hypothetical protein
MRKMKIDSHDDERADMIFKFVVRLTKIAFPSGIVIGIVLKSIPSLCMATYLVEYWYHYDDLIKISTKENRSR